MLLVRHTSLTQVLAAFIPGRRLRLIHNESFADNNEIQAWPVHIAGNTTLHKITADNNH
jgi:hypothetical protein